MNKRLQVQHDQIQSKKCKFVIILHNKKQKQKKKKNEFNTITIQNQPVAMQYESLSRIGAHCFKRARRDKIRDEAMTAPERGMENADPASGDGDGAGEPSCAETVVAAEKIATAKTSIKAVMMLTCAISER